VLRNAGDAARLRKTIVTTFCNELAEKVPAFFVLVFDDFHLVHGSTAVNQAVDQIVHQLPPGAHVILASRMIPTQLNLVGLASRLELAGIGARDMRFRSTEAAELVRRHARPDLSNREITRLVQRAEGWVTAILLSLHGGRDSTWTGISPTALPSGEPAYAYMATQVFEHLPPELQVFLLESAVLNELSPEECDAVLERDESAALLNDVMSRGLFVERLETSADSWATEATEASEVAATVTAASPQSLPWLRYHGLWRDFLLDRLASERPRRLVTLRRRAAQRALDRGDLAAAVEHLNRVGDHGRLADTLLTVAEAEVAAGHAPRLLAWITGLPEAAVESRPRLLVHAARALRRLDRLSDALEHLERGERFAGAAREWDTVYLARASRAVLLAMLRQPDEAVVLVTDLIDQLNRHPRSALLRVQVEREACVALGIAGRSREAIVHGSAALAHLDAFGDGRDRDFTAATVKHTLGVCEDRLGNGGAAAAWYAGAQEHWRALGDDVNQVRVLNQIGKLHQRAGRLEEAAAAFQESLTLVERTGHLSTHAAILNNLARCARERNRLQPALEDAERAVFLARQGEESVFLLDALLEASVLWLRVGESAEALPLLEEARALADERWRPGLPFARALAALAHGRAGHHLEAERASTEAQRALGATTPPEVRQRTVVALAAAAVAAAQPARAVRRLRQARRWARDRSMVAGFFTEVAQYRETAELMLREKRLPPDVLRALRAALDASGDATPAAPPGVGGGSVPRARFELRLFGMPALLRDGADISTWRTRLVRDLLCFLALRMDSLVRTDFIVYSLLPDADFERGATRIRHAMYHLRRLFAPLDPVRTVRGGYRFVGHPEIRCDVAEFARLLAQAEVARREDEEDVQQRRLLAEAIDLYRAPLLDGVMGEWTEAPRAGSESHVLGAMLKLLELHERAGRHQDAVKVARQALEIDEFQERFHIAVIENLVSLDQVSQAVWHFRRYLNIMREELGRDPNPDVVRRLASLTPSLLAEPV